MIVAGALGGMVWAGIVAILRDRFNASEILVSLMLVYVANLLLSYLVFGPWKDPKGFNFPQTMSFASGTALPRIVTLHDIEITPVSGRNAVDPTELTLNVTAKTYRYLDDEEQAVATEPKGKAKKDRKGKKKPAADKA